MTDPQSATDTIILVPRYHARPKEEMMNVHDQELQRSLNRTPAPVTLYLAAAVVVEQGRVLVVRRSKTEKFFPGVWGVPCGKIDAGESAPTAVLRELREETGLFGSVVRYLGTSTFPSIWRSQKAENVQSNFLIHLIGNRRRISLPKEDQAAIWLPKSEIDYFDGLDAHNRGILEQWLHPTSPHQLEPSSAALIASSRRR